MFEARRQGLERFVIGMIVDNTPIRPQDYATPARFSYYSSSAAMCLGEIDGAAY
jgi:hypothetical protein